ncbi:hypothetical protein GGI20_002733 [Coemansia sp. BCRC 34301]|nr:hypothetical protein GGI20_002733 [Coemansia sp. BCRC 34301]
MYMELLKPLLWVCSNFRAIAYPLYCRCFDLWLHNTCDDEPESWDIQSNPFGLPYSALHLVKLLTIQLSDADFYSEDTMNLRSQAPGGGCVFPLVRVLTIYIATDQLDGKSDGSETDEASDIDEVDWVEEPSQYDTIDPRTVEANINAFVQGVKEMMPMLNKVRVEFNRVSDFPAVTRRYIDRLTKQLFQIVKRIEYIDDGKRPVPLTLEVDGICRLSHFKCNQEYDGTQLVVLARLNAPTLQSLDLSVKMKHPASTLIQNDDGSYVTYPQLVFLKMWWSSAISLHQPVFSRDVMPFPNLRLVEMIPWYPFGDDIIFRGNAAMLEHLSMKLYAPTVNMLRRHSVFTPTSHPRLWHVSITYDGNLIPDTFATYEEGVLFLLSIGPGALVREINDYGGIYSSATVLAQLGRHTNIRTLDLGHIRLDLWDVITLIKSLPLLSYLRSLYPKLGALPEGVAKDELPAYVIATHAPIGERFRRWDFRGYMAAESEVDVAICVLVLALACPTFVYATIDIMFRDDLTRWMQMALSLDLFCPYLPRLKEMFTHFQGCPM